MKEKVKLANTIMSAVALVLTAVGSGLILRAFSKEQSLRTPANSLIVSLASADLLFTLFFAFNILTVYESLGCHFVFVHGQLLFFLNTIVLLHVTAISVERLVALKFSLRYSTVVTQFRVRVVIAVVWVVGVVSNVLPLEWASEYLDGDTVKDWMTGAHPKGKNHSSRWEKCLGNRSSPNSTQNSEIHLSEVLFWIDFATLLVPYAATIISQVWVFIISRRHWQQVKAQLQSFSPEHSSAIQQMKHVKTTALVLGSFLLLFTPWIVMVLLMKANLCEKNFKYLMIASILASQSSWLNAPIYAWRNSVFRWAFRKSLKPLVSLCSCRGCRGCCQAPKRVLEVNIDQRSPTQPNRSGAGQAAAATSGALSGEERARQHLELNVVTDGTE